MGKRTHTMRDVATLKQLAEAGQLILATEFQRNSVWPRAAKAYLVDTILCDRPIPYMYFRRAVSAQTGKSRYEVIDGQQRIRALLEFIGDGYSLVDSTQPELNGKYFSDLAQSHKAQILSYDLLVEELTGYSDADIQDIFVRMNKYVVKLSPQEIRHAKADGKFKEFIERLASMDFWKTHKVFTDLQLRRMKAEEFSAELTILLVEGAQDKKAAVDLYYGQYEKTLPFGKEVEAKLTKCLAWIVDAIPGLDLSRYRKPTDLYALVGALDHLTRRSGRLDRLDPEAAGEALLKFEKRTLKENPDSLAGRYLAAASRQTDNIGPRLTRIEILREVLGEA